MNLSCFLTPAECFASALDSWVNWFPYGSYGVIFAAGMVIGAILGRWGVAAVFAVLIALKTASRKEPDMFEHEDPKPVPAPKPKKRPTIFGR